MRKYLPIVAILAILSPLIAPAQAPTYKTYTNARFAYSISYPSKLLTPQGEAPNGDGQKFLSSDGRAELIVYGSHNFNDRSLKDLYDEVRGYDGPNGATYEVLKPGWFVVSGLVAGRVFYQKTILREGVFKTFRLEYDRSAKWKWDPITSKIAGSFRG